MTMRGYVLCLGIVAMVAGGCSKKTNVVFQGTPQPSKVGADEIQLVGSFEGGVQEIGIVEAECAEKTARKGEGAVETCTETEMSGVLAEKAADVGGTHLASVECGAMSEDLLKSKFDKASREVAEKSGILTQPKSILTQVKCRGKVGRAP